MRFVFCIYWLVAFSAWRMNDVAAQPDLSGDLPALGPLLKEKLANDISFKAKEMQLVCEWVHDDVFKRKKISVAFLFGDKDLMKAPVTLEMKKGDTYEMLLLNALKQIDAKHTIHKNEYIRVEREKAK